MKKQNKRKFTRIPGLAEHIVYFTFMPKKRMDPNFRRYQVALYSILIGRPLP